MKERAFYWVSLFTFVLVLTACSSGVPQVVATATPEPPSKVRLVENGDEVKNLYTTSHGFGTYEDVSLEQGMAAAQIMCVNQQTISAGNASLLNVYELNFDNCPELLSGVRAQIVNTETKYTFDCRNCTVTFTGEWEYGEGVSVWRGTIRIMATSDASPSLVFIPLRQP